MPGSKPTWVRPETHRSAEAVEVLTGKYVDDREWRAPVELRRVGTLEAGHVAGELDDCALQSETDPEERDAALAREADRVDLALDSAHTETSGHEDPVEIAECCVQIGTLEIVGGEPRDLSCAPCEKAACLRLSTTER